MQQSSEVVGVAMILLGIAVFLVRHVLTVRFAALAVQSCLSLFQTKSRDSCANLGTYRIVGTRGNNPHIGTPTNSSKVTIGSTREIARPNGEPPQPRIQSFAWQTRWGEAAKANHSSLGAFSSLQKSREFAQKSDTPIPVPPSKERLKSSRMDMARKFRVPLHPAPYAYFITPQPLLVTNGEVSEGTPIAVKENVQDFTNVTLSPLSDVSKMSRSAERRAELTP
jgi:hypothetical protein